MPQVGEIKKGREIGKGITRTGQAHNYMWCACMDCGKERWVHMKKGLPQSKVCLECQLDRMHTPEVGQKISASQKAKKMFGDKAHNWRGGRSQDREGYISLYYGTEGKFSPMVNAHKHIREHRLVMAKHLGRCLQPWEIVHHKNRIKADNRLENLELLPIQAYHISFTFLENINQKLKEQVSALEEEIRRLKGYGKKSTS